MTSLKPGVYILDLLALQDMVGADLFPPTQEAYRTIIKVMEKVGPHPAIKSFEAATWGDKVKLFSLRYNEDHALISEVHHNMSQRIVINVYNPHKTFSHQDMLMLVSPHSIMGTAYDKDDNRYFIYQMGKWALLPDPMMAGTSGWLIPHGDQL